MNYIIDTCPITPRANAAISHPSRRPGRFAGKSLLSSKLYNILYNADITWPCIVLIFKTVAFRIMLCSQSDTWTDISKIFIILLTHPSLISRPNQKTNSSIFQTIRYLFSKSFAFSFSCSIKIHDSIMAEFQKFMYVQNYLSWCN